jgi:leucyl-tRNA synthetase
MNSGILTEPKEFAGKIAREVRKDIISYLVSKKLAETKVTYKLRDWIFSRQRYWGEPIPVIHCEVCGIVPVPEKDLPVKLPKVKNYKPTETGESPLAAISKWVNVKCPRCKGKAKRETDTMPNWAGSSWYYLRYADPKNSKVLASPEALNYWTPVDWYNGGMEHTTLHLLYSRFWHKFLYDIGVVPTIEPYTKRTSHGLILAAGGEKMSKSKGNVISPDGIIQTIGADSLRLYEMFMGPFDQAIAWNTENIAGVRRFIERVWRLKEKVQMEKSPNSLSPGSEKKIEILVHKTIKKVSEDIEAMRFNTAISALMILLNDLERQKTVFQEHYDILLQLLAPFAPHVTEELWAIVSNRAGSKQKNSIHASAWPMYDPTKISDERSTIVVQVNGKIRASFEIEGMTGDEILKNTALSFPEVKKWIGDAPVKKVIVIKGRLVNIVI